MDDNHDDDDNAAMRGNRLRETARGERSCKYTDTL